MVGQRFTQFYFGHASAEEEVARDPGRFVTTYYDRWKLRSRVLAKDFFLIVGPKGSGKTAVSEYMRLILEERYGDSQTFSKTLNLDEVSPGVSALSSITSKLVTDQATATTDAAWRLFISLRLFELMIGDQGNSLARDPQVLRLSRQLVDAGLAESDFPVVLRRVREGKISVSLKGLLAAERSLKSADEVPVSKLGDALLRLVVSGESGSAYTLAIDGLDRIISDNEAYWLTLAALLRVGYDFHRRLRSAQSDVRLLVMCRSDVFRRIRFADADKIAGDAALFVDWAAEQTRPQDSPLWDYLESKAQISPTELFSNLPNEVTVGLRGKDLPRSIPIAQYLIQSTRSTPREMTMLMRRIQEAVPPAGYVTSERVRSAVDVFSSRDLLATVAAEATGLLHPAIDSHLEEILSALPCANNLTTDDFRLSVTQAGIDPALTSALCDFLFLAGLIGNFNVSTGYVQFYHRRDTYRFKRQGPWQLHRGLMYAFNIPYSRGRKPDEVHRPERQ